GGHRGTSTTDGLRRASVAPLPTSPQRAEELQLMLAQQLVNGLSLGALYALFALGFTLIFGVLGVINLSHGAIFMVGAYAGLQAVLRLEAPLWEAMLIGVMVSGLTGLIIDVLVLRPLRRRSALHLVAIISTIGGGVAENV